MFEGREDEEELCKDLGVLREHGAEDTGRGKAVRNTELPYPI